MQFKDGKLTFKVANFIYLIRNYILNNEFKNNVIFLYRFSFCRTLNKRKHKIAKFKMQYKIKSN